MNGEDLITKCDDCDYCLIEDILPERLRKRRCLENGFYKDMKLRRALLADLCLRDKPFPDGKCHVCLMQELVLKAPFDNYMLAQFDAVIKYRYDLMKGLVLNSIDDSCKNETSNIDFNKLWELWNKKAGPRFREIWKLGERKSDDPEGEMYQSLGENFIYEVVVSSDKIYGDIIKNLKSLKIGHNRRRQKGIRCS